MVSIIIPVYNAAPYLEAMLDSVLSQSYKDIQLILVNDGSKDNSSAICHRYAEQYPCVEVYDRENSGVSATRNFGLERANGEFVWFMDSDDLLREGALQTAVTAQEKYGADVVIGGMNFCFAGDGKITTKAVEEEYAFSVPQFAVYYNRLFYKNYISSLCNKLIRRSVIADNRVHMLEELSMYEDYIFCMDVILCCDTVACIPDVLYDYQIRDSAHLSRRYRPNAGNMFSLLKKKITGYLEVLAPNAPEVERSLNNLMVYLAYECIKNESRSPENRKANMRALLLASDFRQAMKRFRGFGLRYRGVHLLMKYRMTTILGWYLSAYEKKHSPKKRTSKK